jgi:hypothetical protein
VGDRRNGGRPAKATVELLPGSRADGSTDDVISGRPNLILMSLAGSNDLSAGTPQSTDLSRLTSMRDAAQTVDLGGISRSPWLPRRSTPKTVQTLRDLVVFPIPLK